MCTLCGTSECAEVIREKPAETVVEVLECPESGIGFERIQRADTGAWIADVISKTKVPSACRRMGILA